MHMTRLTPLFAAALLFSVPCLRAQTAPDPTGHWEGSIRVQDMELAFEVDLAKNTKGELAGTFDSPAQSIQGLPLSNFAMGGKSIRFQIKGASGERAFKGDLSADGKSISGDFTQSGYSMPFSMIRTGDTRFETAAKNAPIGKELEGTWSGTLEAEGKQLRAVLTLANQPDGSATGTVLSVDEGLDIPIATITQKGSKLTLELKAVGGVFAGTLNPEGTELAGTYTQRSLAVPVTFRRSAEEKK